MVTREGRGKIAWSLRSNPMVLSTLLIILSRFSRKFNVVSRRIPRCLCKGTCTMLWLKYIESWFKFRRFLENRTSWACITWIRLELIFHDIAQSLVLLRSLFKLFADVFTSWTTDKSEVSSANSLTLNHNRDH